MIRKQYQKIISARGWNRFVDFYFRHRIRSVVTVDSDPWRHPWFCRVEWDGVDERWTLRVKPGFCWSETGDADPEVTVPLDLAGLETLDRLEISENASHDDDEEKVVAYLTEYPVIPLGVDLFRSIGTDAVGTESERGEAVPAFFSEQGVMGPVVVRQGGDSGLIEIREGDVEDRKSARLLRACDVVLSHDRSQRVTEVVTTNLANDSDGVAVSVELQGNATGRSNPFLYAARQFSDQVESDYFAFLRSGGTDPARDSIHIATIYLMSQRGAEEGSDPDGTWQAFVRHHVRWNLQYVQKTIEISPDPVRITVPVPTLALGELGRVGGSIADDINDRTQQMEAAVSVASALARFETM